MRNSWLRSSTIVVAVAFSILALTRTEAQTTAVRNNDFLNSMGINTHISTGADNTTNVIAALKLTGIRHIRDGGSRGTDLIRVYNETAVAGVRPGAKVCLLSWNGEPAGSVRVATPIKTAGALMAMEGPNEPNNWPMEYPIGSGNWSNRDTTFLPVAQFQAALYTAIKASTSPVKDVPVIHSSHAAGGQPNNCGMQFLTIPSGTSYLMPAGTKFADYANCHNYISPANVSLANNSVWNAYHPTTTAGPALTLYREYGVTWKRGYTGYNTTQLATLPRYSTENGWYTAAYQDRQRPVSQSMQGKIIMNIFLAAYKQGWSKTFIYQMRDQDFGGGVIESYGLYTTGWVKKTAVDYLHNFTSILQDVGSGTPGTLNYSIPNRPTTTHDLLLQKSNGTFQLAVWSELISGTSSITVNLGQTFPTVRIYDPTVGKTPTQTLTNVSSVPLTVSDHVLIIEIPSSTTRLETYNPPSASTGDSHTVVTETGASGGTSMNYAANAISDYVSYESAANLAPGTYSLRVGFKVGPQRPRFQTAVALTGSGVWTNVGGVIDGYSSTLSYNKFTVGNFTVTTSGRYKFKLTATGRNAAATGTPWSMVVDYFEWVKQ